MNKSELINSLSEETTFSKKDVSRVLDSLTRIIERTLKKRRKSFNYRVWKFLAFTSSSSQRN